MKQIHTGIPNPSVPPEGQPFLAKPGVQKVGLLTGLGSSTTIDAIGLAAPTAVGTATSRVVATTNLTTMARRVGVVSATTAGSFSDLFGAQQFFRGATAGQGGFEVLIKFAPSNAAAVTGERFFAGLRPTAAFTNVEPDTLVNCVGVAQLSGSTNLQFVCNDASGVTTTIDLGADFPANGLSTDLYTLWIFASPAGSNIKMELTRNNSGGSTGIVAFETNLPVATTLLGYQICKTNNATALAVGFDLVDLLITTPN